MVGLGIDLEGVAEAVELVDVGRSEVGLHRLEDVAERDPERFGLDPLDLQLRRAPPGTGLRRPTERPGWSQGPIGCRLARTNDRKSARHSGFAPVPTIAKSCVSHSRALFGRRSLLAEAVLAALPGAPDTAWTAEGRGRIMVELERPPWKS
jgi:hypothetical protein